jgi:hypothetical protein
MASKLMKKMSTTVNEESVEPGVEIGCVEDNSRSSPAHCERYRHSLRKCTAQYFVLFVFSRPCFLLQVYQILILNRLSLISFLAAHDFFNAYGNDSDWDWLKLICVFIVYLYFHSEPYSHGDGEDYVEPHADDSKNDGLLLNQQVTDIKVEKDEENDEAHSLSSG